jgi:LDH2 family malate/lactate/ureidoglycolate dehydrogenase
MVKAGTSPDHSRQLADLLIAADQRGHYSHGVNRLGVYFTDVKTTTANGDGKFL